MNQQEKKRHGIFNKYVENLNFLVDYNFIVQSKNNYLCPICLEPHNKLNLPNPLTLEDAPPKSLGGKSNILTCKKCNNTCGYKIDAHLTQRLRDLDKLKLTPDSSFPIEFEIDNIKVRGRMNIDKDGKQNVTVSNQNNNSKTLPELMQNIVGKPFEPYVIPGKVDEKNLEYALLKTAYLMAFERFGYLLILDDCFNIVREQLLNPHKAIYPDNFWIKDFPMNINDAYIVCNENIESLLSVFTLDTGITKFTFGVSLPLPKYNINFAIENLNKGLKNKGNIKLELFPNDKINYLTDIVNILSLYAKIN